MLATYTTLPLPFYIFQCSVAQLRFFSCAQNRLESFVPLCFYKGSSGSTRPIFAHLHIFVSYSLLSLFNAYCSCSFCSLCYYYFAHVLNKNFYVSI